MAQINATTISYTTGINFVPQGYELSRAIEVAGSGTVYYTYTGYTTSTEGMTIEVQFTYVPSDDSYIRTATLVSSSTAINTDVPIGYAFVGDSESTSATHRRAEAGAPSRAQSLYEEMREESKAKEKSRALLVSLLDERQREQLETRGSFDVIGKDGNKYNIFAGNAYNVIVKGKDGRTIRYCAVPDGKMPIFDIMLAQKLMIEHDLARFKRIANTHIVQ